VAPRDLFLLDPAFVYLNHGSFGACPRPVFDVYQRWQRELERQPVNFLARRLEDELTEVRTRLAAYVGAAADELALVPNATFAMNAILRALPLEPGDEILTTGHEYGAIELLLDFVAARSGARIVRRSPEEIRAGASRRTRVLVISHVTSPTALLLPVDELCRAAREAGVLSVVDGAHAPGHVPLDLESLGADFYAGNCHKWLCAPKGAAFLYARPESQALLEPAVVGWGYRQQAFQSRHGWQGSCDPSAYLSIPAAIDFVCEHGRAAECRELLQDGRTKLAEAGFAPLAPPQPLQMASFLLPECDPEAVELRLLNEFRIEAPVRIWNGERLIRVSIAPYNDTGDLKALVAALRELL
jgi:isopenicillin-N epimerase